jgi:hypothetical protein
MHTRPRERIQPLERLPCRINDETRNIAAQRGGREGRCPRRAPEKYHQISCKRLTTVRRYGWLCAGIATRPEKCLQTFRLVVTVQYIYHNLDDIIVYSKSFEQHTDVLDKVFTALRDAGLKLNASKFSFGVNRVTYFGHIIFKHGIEVDLDKVQAVREFPVPRNTIEVRAFYGFCNYFRRFIPNFGETEKALTDLCKKYAKLRWTDIQQLAFDQLKILLCVVPV